MTKALFDKGEFTSLLKAAKLRLLRMHYQSNVDHIGVYVSTQTSSV